jgi:hypothetical protein
MNYNNLNNLFFCITWESNGILIEKLKGKATWGTSEERMIIFNSKEI